MNNFQSQAEKTYSGKTPDGTQINVNVVIDPEATLTVNVVDVINNPATKGTDNEWADTVAPGFTDNASVGNTQTGTVQISSKNSTFEGTPTDAQPGAGGTTTHELGHIFGLPDNVNNVQGNRMNNNPGNNKTDRNITPEQRQTMLNNIPEKK